MTAKIHTLQKIIKTICETPEKSEEKRWRRFRYLRQEFQSQKDTKRENFKRTTRKNVWQNSRCTLLRDSLSAR